MTFGSRTCKTGKALLVLLDEPEPVGLFQG